VGGAERWRKRCPLGDLVAGVVKRFIAAHCGVYKRSRLKTASVGILVSCFGRCHINEPFNEFIAAQFPQQVYCAPYDLDEHIAGAVTLTSGMRALPS
jgi:hypothetical protein